MLGSWESARYVLPSRTCYFLSQATTIAMRAAIHVASTAMSECNTPHISSTNSTSTFCTRSLCPYSRFDFMSPIMRRMDNTFFSCQPPCLSLSLWGRVFHPLCCLTTSDHSHWVLPVHHLPCAAPVSQTANSSLLLCSRGFLQLRRLVWLMKIKY
jgi:hypothetical protein